MNIHAIFARARREGRVGVARKAEPIDARPARPGEVIVTVLKGEGEETRSPPAVLGDFVVRSRSDATGHEEYLVRSRAFRALYGEKIGLGADWQTYFPDGRVVYFMVIDEREGPLSFLAPWGTPTRAEPGDVIIQYLDAPRETYRVSAAAFAATYTVVKPPASERRPL